MMEQESSWLARLWTNSNTRKKKSKHKLHEQCYSYWLHLPSIHIGCIGVLYIFKIYNSLMHQIWLSGGKLVRMSFFKIHIAFELEGGEGGGGRWGVGANKTCLIFPFLHLHAIWRASFHHLRTNVFPICW